MLVTFSQHSIWKVTANNSVAAHSCTTAVHADCQKNDECQKFVWEATHYAVQRKRI